MVQLSPKEQTLVEDLLACVAEAMRRRDDINPTYASKTKLQKLLYLAIDEFDLPLTYSWYLAGAIVPGDGATPAGLQSSFDDVAGPSEPSLSTDEPGTTSNAATSTDASDEFSDFLNSVTPREEDDSIDPVLFSPATDGKPDPSTPAEIDDRRADIVDFYEGKLPDVWYQNTMRFLQNFYLEHAPAPYRDLYVQSTHLRTRLRDVENTVMAHLDGDEPTQSLADLNDAIGLDISDLHCTIRSTESLSETFDGFVRGTGLIEDGLLMLTKRSPDELDQEHLAAVKSMQDFFYYYVWRYPCLIISRDTATGPSAESLRAKRVERLAEFEDELRREADRFEEELAEAGLKPEYADYPSPDSDVTETITSLSDHYLE